MLNLDTSTLTRHYYRGNPASVGAVFVLDFQPPSHCSFQSPGCSADLPLLAINGEVVSEGNISITWGGWLDQPAAINSYLLSIYHLEVSGGLLFEGMQINLTSYNESGGGVVYEELTQLPTEGPYSVILQTFDNAGNVRYSRRLVLFDESSFVDIEPLAPLTAVSAVQQTNYLWQNSTSDPIIISGRGHFYNSLLLNRNFLAPVGDSFNGSIAKEYDHPITQGRYPRGGTANALGIVSLRYEVVIDQVGGDSTESLSPPENFRFESDDIGIDAVSINADLADGDSVRVWFLASDYNFQQVNDSVLVHVDSSGPLLSDPTLQRNTVGGINLHGTGLLTDLTFQFTVQDQHSGIQNIEWSIGTGLGLTDIGNGSVPVNIVPMSACAMPVCVCDSVQHCSTVQYAFSPPLSDLVTMVADHDTEYYITIIATNHALLSTLVSLEFTVDTTPPLPGAVFDGPPASADVDYASNLDLRGWWGGFFDRESDILVYQYVFGSECANATSFTYPLEVGSIVMETNMESATAQAQGKEIYPIPGGREGLAS